MNVLVMLCVCLCLSKLLFLSVFLLGDQQWSESCITFSLSHLSPFFSVVCLPTLSNEKVLGNYRTGGDAEIWNGRGWVEASLDQAKKQTPGIHKNQEQAVFHKESFSLLLLYPYLLKPRNYFRELKNGLRLDSFFPRDPIDWHINILYYVRKSFIVCNYIFGWLRQSG